MISDVMLELTAQRYLGLASSPSCGNLVSRRLMYVSPFSPGQDAKHWKLISAKEEWKKTFDNKHNKFWY